MVWFKPADFVDDAVLVPSLKLSEAGYDESRMRDSVDVGDV